MSDREVSPFSLQEATVFTVVLLCDHFGSRPARLSRRDSV